MPLTPKTGATKEELTKERVERIAGDAANTTAIAEAKSIASSKYTKPSSGIPASDLSSVVQASLAKADTAIQEHQSLSGYATEEWVEEQGYLTEHQDITGKVDKMALFDNPDTTPKVKSALLPSYVDDVLEYSSISAFPATGESGKIYVALDTNKTYRWTGTQYTEIAKGADVVAPSTSASDAGKAADAKATGDALALKANTASLGTAASKDVPTSGNASTTQVVMGNDTRLSDSRTPTSHTHAQSDVSGLTTALADKLSMANGGTVAGYVTMSGGAMVQSGMLVEGNFSVSFGPESDAGAWQIYKDFETGKFVLYAFVGGVGGSNSSILTLPFSAGTAALLENLAPAYDSSHTYAVGDLAVVDGVLKRCTTAGTGSAAVFAAATVEDALAAIRAAIPAAQVNADWDAVSGVAQILNKPTIPNPNLLTYTSGTTLNPATAVYRSALNNDGTFPTITDTGIPAVAAYYQFELELAVPSAVPSTITGPTGWTWLDGHGLPDPADLSGSETICISVRLDCTARTFLASVWRVA
jgi:hypothetical protein